MKKIIAVIVCLLVMLASGCGGTTTPGIDPNKTQIYILVYNGGIGTQWIEDLASEWSAQNSEYEVIIDGRKLDSAQIMADVQSGSIYSAYFTADVSYFTGIYSGLFEDISDILDRKPDGEDGLTIGEKLTNENWTSYASRNGSGVYMLPYAEAFMGMIYDHDLFLEKGWLDKASVAEKTDVEKQGIVCTVSGQELKFVSSEGRTNYEEGDVILSKGKDGKYGTYDDGQKTTESGFEQLIETILSAPGEKVVPFIYSGRNLLYVSPIIKSVFAQYSGMDAFKAYNSYDSGGKPIRLYNANTGAVTEEVITIDNGYKVYQSEGLYKGLEFADKYFNESAYLHPAATGDVAHGDTQNFFITGYRGNESNPQAAFLIDGNWWENEARATFNQLGSSSGRGFGEREYRFYLLPEFDGQQGVEGNKDVSVMTVQDNGVILVPKEDDKMKLEALKDFLAYTCSDEALRRFTVETGSVRPYKYTLTDEDRAKMTKFAINTYDIYTDRENVCISTPFLDKSAAPINFTTSVPQGDMASKTSDGAYHSYPLAALRRHSVKEVFIGSTLVDVSTWNGYVAQAREQGFYIS